ncbi:MAG: hypothetical protein NTU53_15490 [Planctomycetota bacterium]|nr:hypothetical protein [Planctomycetota bacterium]
MSENQPVAGKRDLGACFAELARGLAFRNAIIGEPAGEAIAYVQPLLDVIRLFEELGIKYAIVGGIAATYYGGKRFSEGPDFVIASEDSQVLERKGEVMRRHRFALSNESELRHASGVEGKLWIDGHADEVVERACVRRIAGRLIRVADVHDLIAMQLRADRVQDDYDISEILKKTAVDDEVVRARVTTEQFGHYLAVKQRI